MSSQAIFYVMFVFNYLNAVSGVASPSINSKSTNKLNSNYYVSPDGDDDNPGTADKPWKTMRRINHVHLSPGDSVILSSDDVFEGTLFLENYIADDRDLSIVVTTTDRNEATIDAGDSAGIYLKNCKNVHITNLVIKGSGRKYGNTSDGVYVENCQNIQLNHLEVYGFQHSGIHLFKNINTRVTNVYAHDNGFAGINVSGTTIYDTTHYDNKNIYIGHCIAENNPGDPTVNDNHSGNGILVASVDGAVIEYCEAFNNGWDMPWNGNGPVGIWIWDANNVMIQHCISHHNKTAKSAADGGGFDFDGGVSNSVLQYNLSYENQGPGIGLFEFGAGKIWHDNVVRYNLSYNDATNGTGSIGIWKGGGEIHNCKVYNNTIYNSNPEGSIFWLTHNLEGMEFYNNIFVYDGPFLHVGQTLKNEKFLGNCYWNLNR